MAADCKSSGEITEITMDPELWGVLQHYVDLENVYAKLPSREIFRLRVVCKEWNRLASDRRFLEDKFKDPIPNPYFCLHVENADSKLCWAGLLSYNVFSGLWSWTRLRTSTHYDRIFVLEGLIYMYRRFYSNTRRKVYNIHTKVWHTLPPKLEHGLETFVVMTVDTSVRPYSFKIVSGSSDFCTQIYDVSNNKWETKPSSLSRTIPLAKTNVCAQYNGRVYMATDDQQQMLTYDLEKDVWSNCGPSLPYIASRLHGSIGAWQGQIFCIGEKSSKIIVWILSEALNTWEGFDCMPDKLYRWLVYKGKFLPWGVHVQLLLSFCSEYVLVFTQFGEVTAERFVMYNLATKVWERIDVPSLPLPRK